MLVNFFTNIHILKAFVKNPQPTPNSLGSLHQVTLVWESNLLNRTVGCCPVDHVSLHHKGPYSDCHLDQVRFPQLLFCWIPIRAGLQCVTTPAHASSIVIEYLKLHMKHLISISTVYERLFYKDLCRNSSYWPPTRVLSVFNLVTSAPGTSHQNLWNSQTDYSECLSLYQSTQVVLVSFSRSCLEELMCVIKIPTQIL